VKTTIEAVEILKSYLTSLSSILGNPITL